MAMFCKSILVFSLLAMTHALPHAKLSARQTEIAGSPDEITSDDGSVLVNIQTYNGTLGANPVPVYYNAGLGVGNGNHPFNVSGVSYDQVYSAVQNACSIQMNLCVDAANDGSIGAAVSDCTDQQSECNDVATTLSESTEYQAKKRDLSSEIEADIESAASELEGLVDGSETSTEALSSLENLIGLKFKMIRRAIRGLFVGT